MAEIKGRCILVGCDLPREVRRDPAVTVAVGRARGPDDEKLVELRFDSPADDGFWLEALIPREELRRALEALDREEQEDA